MTIPSLDRDAQLDRATLPAPRTAKSRRRPISAGSALWREKSAHEIGPTDLVAASALLRKTSLFRVAKWDAARAGSAADAIAVAVAEWPLTAVTPRIDVIMTALMYCAMTGSAAAAVVMSHVLRQIPEAGKRHKRLATSWLARNVEIGIAKRAPRPSAPIRLRNRAGAASWEMT